jgi:hypothetical protein
MNFFPKFLEDLEPVPKANNKYFTGIMGPGITYKNRL